MASFQAKIGCKTQRMREIKIFIAFRSVPTLRVIEKFQKNSKKIEKTQQYHYGFISSQNRLDKAENEKK